MTSHMLEHMLTHLMNLPWTVFADFQLLALSLAKLS